MNTINLHTISHGNCSEAVIKTAHKLRNANPRSHSSSGLLESNKT
ncbi:MAG: Abia family HEPN domain-containing protein [Faecousia sp.]